VLKAETLYHSTNLKAPAVTFREALLKGLAPDGGLYMPRRLPLFTPPELEEISGLSYPLLAYEIIGRILGKEIDSNDLERICSEIYTFTVPVERISEREYLMRLDQGPTASFKDFAALLMGRLMQYFLRLNERHITILTATSGDTGSAVANAFHGLENIKVVILFPSGEVTNLQRKQMTTFNDNIVAAEIDGKFDDCQRLVKTAFMDPELSGLNLSSANSINIGRLLPQSVYYFRAWAAISRNPGDQVTFSVPSGNFGNLSGGLLAREMGLPVKRFVAATNANDEVPRFLKTGAYTPVSPSRNCISSAMNVGHPSNLSRIISMYDGRMDEKGTIMHPPDIQRMNQDIFGASISDDVTRDTIRSFYMQYGKILEPHGAVAWAGLLEYTGLNHETPGDSFVCLETAHPAKFSDEIKGILGIEPELPDSLRSIESRKEEFISLENNYEQFKKLLIQNY
jgi:threonine synthase